MTSFIKSIRWAGRESVLGLVDICLTMTVGLLSWFGFIGGIALGIARFWTVLGLLIGPTRVTFTLILVAAVMLLGTPQGRELAASMSEASPLQWFFFNAAVLWWALQAWYWPRSALRYVFGERVKKGWQHIRVHKGKDGVQVWRAPVIGDANEPPIQTEKARELSRITKMHPGWLIAALPRIYAGAVIALAVMMFLVDERTRAEPAAWEVMGTVLASGTLFVVFLMMRTRIPWLDYDNRRHRKRFFTETLKDNYARRQVKAKLPEMFEQFTMAGFLFIIVCFVVTLVFFGFSLIDPVTLGDTLGAAGVSFLAFACITPIGSMLIRASREFRFPLLAVVTLLIVFWSFILDDDHMVRPVGPVMKVDTDPRDDVEKAVCRWLAGNGIRTNWNDVVARTFNPGRLTEACIVDPDSRAAITEPLPITFVATAGGGVRAGYWTGSVLGRMFDCVPDLERQVFSISGVSGGSVGALFYLALSDGLTETRGEAGDQPACAPVRAPAEAGTAMESLPDASLQRHLADALSRDFLGPTFSGLFFNDVFQSVLPIHAIGAPGFLGIDFDLGDYIVDRGEALELSWEAAVERTCRGGNGTMKGLPCAAENPLAGAFLDLWPAASTWPGSTADARWRPIMLVNGTHQQTGKRLITSNLRVEDNVFVDTYDFHFLTHRDLIASSAALNSARFPLVTPAGRLVDWEIASLDHYSADADAAQRGHVLDGGYFENYGTETTAELADAVLKIASRLQIPLQPIFIEIHNDIAVMPEDLDRRPQQFRPDAKDEAPALPKEPDMEEVQTAQIRQQTYRSAPRTRGGSGKAGRDLRGYIQTDNPNEGVFLSYNEPPYESFITQILREQLGYFGGPRDPVVNVAIDDSPRELRTSFLYGVLDELAAPPQGLYTTRTARGVLASKNLARLADSNPYSRAFCEQLLAQFVANKDLVFRTSQREAILKQACFTRHADAAYYRFRLCPGVQPEPPLGWMLARKSREAMDTLILTPPAPDANTDLDTCHREVLAQMASVIERLGGSTPEGTPKPRIR